MAGAQRYNDRHTLGSTSSHDNQAHGLLPVADDVRPSHPLKVQEAPVETFVARMHRIRKNLGWRCTVHFVAMRLLSRLPGPQMHVLRPRAVHHPLLLRAGTSDLDVFGQIFSGDEYASVSGLDGVSVIVDGGANVGYSAAYFLSKYPEATVISVEPDAENVELLRRNLAPYGRRSIVVQAALWSSLEDLVITTGFRDARHWSRQVQRADGSANAMVRGVTVERLMSMASATHISILKLDIEGAEAELFRTGYDDWIGAVDTFVVELHDDGGFGPATEYFRAALSPLEPSYTTSGELTIARIGRISARGQPTGGSESLH